MAEWASVTAVISGLLAIFLLAGSIHLAEDPTAVPQSHRERCIAVMATGGLAASALFGFLLIARLVAELLALTQAL